MNSNEMIGLAICLCLMAAFYLFRPQFSILLRHLAHLDFSAGKDKLAKPSLVTTKDTKPWAWHNAWINSFLHPNDVTWKRLRSEKSISFKNAYAWITITSLLFSLAYYLVVWIKFPASMTTSVLLKYIKYLFLIGIFEPIAFTATAGIIHIIAKIFGRGNFHDFFVIYATSYVPISLLYTFIAVLRWSFASEAWLDAGVLLNFYFVIFVSTRIIKFNYQINRLKALLINLAVTAVQYFLAFRIYYATGLGK